MTTGDVYEIIAAETLVTYPKFNVVNKSDSALMKGIDVFLKVVTFGQAKQFMTNFTTTIGYTVYVSPQWDKMSPESKATVLRHERVHMMQASHYGVVWFSLLYLLVFFPVFLAYWRTRFEKQAYVETLRAYHDYGFPLDANTKQRVCEYFTGPAYGWMWPFKKNISDWYDATLKQVMSEPR